jgi:L-ascorbate metabolism protein UlaG (beta-lactamase superfamily)
MKGERPVRYAGISFSVLLIVVGLASGASGEKGDSVMEVVSSIHWLGQAAVRMEVGDTTLYIDPYKLKGGPKADVILITHCHADHCSPDDIKQILSKETMVVAPADCMDKLGKLGVAQMRTLKPGESTKAKGIAVAAVPAYNVVKANFHPKSNQWVGYIVTVNGVRVYHFGDTERTPEMKETTCDVALVPLGQTYTMSSVEEAAAAVRDVHAKVAIPIHYGMYEGTDADAQTLKKLLAGQVEVVIKTHE